MKSNHKYTGPLSLTGAFLILIGSANAAVVFTDNFEPTGSGSNATSLLGSGNTANVTGYQQGAINNTLWVGTPAAGFGSDRFGLVDESSGSFTDPTGTQGFAKRYPSNTGLTSAASTIGSLAAGTIITLTFDAVLDGGGVLGGDDIAAYLVLFNGGARDSVNPSDYTGTSAVLARALFTNSATSSYNTYTLTYTVGDSLIDNDGAGAGTSTAWNPALLGQDIGIRFGNNQNAIIDNVSLDISAIPEPSAVALGGLGVLLFVLRRRR